MKVAFIVTHISRGSPGSFERIRLLCTHLNNKGIECTILTPYEEELTSGVRIKRIPTLMSKLRISSASYSLVRKLSNSRIGSKILLSEVALDRMIKSLIVDITKTLMKNKFDIIHAVQPIAGLACVNLPKPITPIVTDLHNIWPEELVTYGIINRNDATFLRLQDKEKKIINFSDSITVPSSSMKSYILKNYSPSRDSIVVIPPAGFVSNTEADRNSNVVYTGMVSRREHVDLFARSIEYIKTKASFYISNYGDDLKAIKKITARAGYPDVFYSWFKTRDELISFLRTSRVGIVTSQNDICRQMGPALKLFDYLSCGVPVVANDIGGWTQMIEDENVGILTEDNPRSFGEAIDLLLTDNELWNIMHKNALNLIRKGVNWESHVSKILIPLYEKVLKEH